MGEYKGTREELIKHSKGWRRWLRHNEGHILIGFLALALILIIGLGFRR